MGEAGGERQEAGIERRAVLRRVAALGGAAVAAAVVLRPEAAGAASGTMIYGNGGTGNDAGSSLTTLRSDNASYTLNLMNGSFGSGLVAQSSTGRAAFFRQNAPTTHDAIVVEKPAGGGAGVRVTSGGDDAGITVFRSSWAVAGAAVDATQSLSGPVFRATSGAPGNSEPLFEGRHHGVGGGVKVGLTNPDSQGTAVEATAEGKGVAVHGISKKGRGAVFQGKAAQARLVPGSLATHPASGAPGDLYVDSANRLWFCKGGSNWVKLA